MRSPREFVYPESVAQIPKLRQRSGMSLRQAAWHRTSPLLVCGVINQGQKTIAAPEQPAEAHLGRGKIIDMRMDGNGEILVPNGSFRG